MADPTRRSTRFSMRSKQIGQLLLEAGDVKAEQIAQALKVQEQQGGLLGQLLRNMEACSVQAISSALLKQVQVTDVKCEELQVAPEVAGLVPRELCEAERLCPFERLGGLLCVVMGNPLNRKAISQIEEKARLKVKSFKAPWPRISELLGRTYGAQDLAPVEEAPPVIEGAGGEVLTVEEVTLAPAVEAAESGGEAAVPPVAELPPTLVQPSPAGSGFRQRQQPEAPAEPTIEGIDDLDGSHAEVVETTRRGLRRRERKGEEIEEAPQPKVEKKAKVNVDLDQLDLSAGEMVSVEEAEGELEEVAPARGAPPAATALRPLAAGMARLQAVPDSYFYADGDVPPDGRSDELLALLETLPLAEVIAQSIGDYESQQRAKAAPAKPAAPAEKPVELQPAPAGSMSAVVLSEAEFNKAVASLAEDPVGEWDWQYAAPGPVRVVAYDET